MQDPNEAFECRSTLIWISGLIIREKLDAFLEAGMELGYFVDGTVAQDSTQAGSFWEIREVSLHMFVDLIMFEWLKRKS